MNILNYNFEVKKNFLDLFKDTLLQIYLVGSAGKNCFIDGFSDLDYLIILKKEDANLSNKIKCLKDKFSSYKIHVGLSIITLSDIYNNSIKPRCLLYLFEISNKENICLYSSNNFKLDFSKIDFNKLFDINEELNRIIAEIETSSKNDFRYIYKRGLLIKKLLLRNKKIILYDPKCINEKVKEIYNIDKFNLIDIFKNKNSYSISIEILQKELIDLINTIKQTAL